jgi:tRNA threonylcarbamoyladenosine biosynthesis protein TsaB
VNILAIDTATDVLSLALGSGETELWSFEAAVGLRHAELVLPCIDTLFKTAGITPQDLNMVACMQGPGSFTGVRIGFSTAKGLALALTIPLVAVPTLDCMAYPWKRLEGLVMPVLDAKRHRYFAALYSQGLRISEYCDSSAADLAGLLPPHEPVLLIGPAAAMAAQEWGNPAGWSVVSDNTRGNARALIDCVKEGYGVRGTELRPLYLRKSDAEEKRDHPPSEV